MKKSNYILLFICFLSSQLLQAQEVKESKFSIISFGGIGYGIVVNDKQPNYNLNSNNGELLLNYKVNKKFGLATGIGLNELSGSGFNANGNFYHERSLIKIPLLGTMDYPVSDKVKMIGNFGFFAQNIIKDNYRFQNTVEKDNFDGWNFGAQIGLGFVFKMSNYFSAGINYSGQSDFSKFKSTNTNPTDDKQKIKNLNSIGVILQIDL